MDIELITKTVNEAYKSGYLKKIYRGHSAGYSEEEYKQICFYYYELGVDSWNDFMDAIMHKFPSSTPYSPEDYSGVIYPFQVSQFFPYPKADRIWQDDMGMGLWNPELAISRDADVKSICEGIKEAYDFNCDFIRKRINVAFFFFKDMSNVMGLVGEPLDLVKQSLELFAPYSDKAKDLLDHFGEIYEYNNRIFHICANHAKLGYHLMAGIVKSLEDK